MSIITEIRSLYKPMQPAVKQSDENIMYAEVLPHKALQPFIYCYWQLKDRKPLTSPYNYLVVADGCIDIVFDLQDARESYVMGFCDKFNEFPMTGTFNKIGIRFLPTMFPQLFNIKAMELSNRLEKLEFVIPYIADYISKHFNETQNLDDVKTLLDNRFLALIANTNIDHDNRLYEALEIILRHSDSLKVEKDLETGISTRQLRRIFEFYVGDTAKTFSQVVRFQKLLNSRPSSEALRKHKIFFDMGYYDQSHFIREFKNLYGLTPKQAFHSNTNILAG
ncbi:MAG: AraC family transcriptional regulator [Chitinophagaceae bacterium]|nr:MAG: AraC family transcriptional regulator [Chitinophagaceae bacterium]